MRIEKGQHSDTGKVLVGILSLFGQLIQFMDTEAAYACLTFSWSTSLHANCSDEVEFNALLDGLAQGGVVMMKDPACGTGTIAIKVCKA